MKRILVDGSCGYVGSLLVPQLLAREYQVVGYDAQFFGDGFLPQNNDSLTLFKADLRDLDAYKAALEGCEAVIAMGCLSNDYCCALDPKLSDEINMQSFEPRVIAAKAAGVQRFIYCSSSSVYGINDAPEVTEDMPLVPLTAYNTFKAACEPLLFKHQAKGFDCVTIRPATVCGPAPRMRFDLTVNVMTRDAVLKGVITVNGGEQKRPNLHIKDMCRAYHLMLEAPAEKIAGEVFNIGRQNMTVRDIAFLIKAVVDREMNKSVEVKIAPYADNRTYKINSDKVKEVLGFEPKFTVEDAIRDICHKFQDGYWKDALENRIYTNVLQYVEAYGMGAK